MPYCRNMCTVESTSCSIARLHAAAACAVLAAAIGAVEAPRLQQSQCTWGSCLGLHLLLPFMRGHVPGCCKLFKCPSILQEVRLGSTDLGSPLQGRKQQDRPGWRTSGCLLMRQWPPLPAHREHLCWAAPQWSRLCSCDPAGSAVVTLWAAQILSCCCGLRSRLRM